MPSYQRNTGAAVSPPADPSSENRPQNLHVFLHLPRRSYSDIPFFPASLPAPDNFFPAMHMQCHCPDKNVYLLHVLSSGPKHPYFPDDPDPDAKKQSDPFLPAPVPFCWYTQTVRRLHAAPTF